ncbi:alpha-glucosidase [Nicoliella spurrieriana]|uniref:Alpha-glucosidase n=1 Tax=Nicoliella spurrieriana TaxID=2925830 RepID=A0A976RT61_9LACO|nr:alpha-glucosidase [Nicoliella spurrieriana]UQS87372.1 alpha-glucosidase [Nicoliella spurrieriana]
MAKNDWFKDSVVYQIYPMSFQDSNGDGIGDLKGIESRLDYVKKLGANTIWLNPIYKSPNKDNGYDIADYESIQPAYGTMADFDSLLAAMHSKGIKLLMDLVVNHTSDQNEWFQESKKSRDNKYADFYIWRDPVDGHAPNNWGSNFAGSAWTFVPERGQYYLHCFAEGQPDLNWRNPEVREAVYSLMRFWLDKGVDGFRMDVINYISKPDGLPDGPVPAGSKYSPCEPLTTNGPHLLEYLNEMNDKVLSKYDMMTVGEMPATNPEDAVRYANLDGSGLNMIFQFEHVSLSFNPDQAIGKWNDEPVKLTELKHSLSRWQAGLDGKSWNSLYWNNHDQPRAVSRFANDEPEFRVRAAKMLGTTLHMLQGTPYVYEGEELGMTNGHFTSLDQYEDIESINAYKQIVDQEHLVSGDKMLSYLASRSRDNARTPMQWDNGKYAGFTTGDKPWYRLNANYPEINAADELVDQDSVFYYYQKLIQLRRDNDIIRYGRFEALDPKDDAVFAYKRHYNDLTLVSINNFTAESVARDYQIPAGAQLLIGNYADDQGTELRPFESKVYLF